MIKNKTQPRTKVFKIEVNFIHAIEFGSAEVFSVTYFDLHLARNSLQSNCNTPSSEGTGYEGHNIDVSGVPLLEE